MEIFFQQLKKIEVAPAENIDLFKRYIDENKVTFISWKMPKISLKDGGIIVNPNFNLAEANQYIGPEKDFLRLLKDNEIGFNYIKIIPDELVFYFWGVSKSKEFKIFKNQIKSYFKRIYPKTKVYLLSELIKKGGLENFYKNIFNKVYAQVEKGAINKNEFDREVLLRSKYYGPMLDKKEGIGLAIKAFALFASESATLFQLQKLQLLNNVVLIAGKRSMNTYKYDFYKFPKSRPILPKLFVI